MKMLLVMIFQLKLKKKSSVQEINSKACITYFLKVVVSFGQSRNTFSFAKNSRKKCAFKIIYFNQATMMYVLERRHTLKAQKDNKERVQ